MQRTIFILSRTKPKDMGYGLTRIIKGVDINTNELVTMFVKQYLFEPKADKNDLRYGFITSEEYWESSILHLPAFYEVARVNYQNDKPDRLTQYDRRDIESKRELFPILDRVKRAVKLTYVDEIEKVGQFTVSRDIHLELKDCEFGNGFVRDLNSGVLIPAPEGVAFDPLMNNIRDGMTGTIDVTGTFYVHLRKVKDNWRDVLIPKEGDLEIVDFDVRNLNELFKQYQIEAAYFEMVSFIRHELARGRFLREKDIVDIARRFKVEVRDPAELLRLETFKKEFRGEFVWYLDEIAEDSWYGASSFFFRVGDKWVWEVPVPGAATYVFDDSLPIAELSAKAISTSRNVIMAKPELLGYVGRVIHPSVNGDGEINPNGVKYWKTRLGGLMGYESKE